MRRKKLHFLYSARLHYSWYIVVKKTYKIHSFFFFFLLFLCFSSVLIVAHSLICPSLTHLPLTHLPPFVSLPFWSFWLLFFLLCSSLFILGRVNPCFLHSAASFLAWYSLPFFLFSFILFFFFIPFFFTSPSSSSSCFLFSFLFFFCPPFFFLFFSPLYRPSVACLLSAFPLV